MWGKQSQQGRSNLPNQDALNFSSTSPMLRNGSVKKSFDKRNVVERINQQTPLVDDRMIQSQGFDFAMADQIGSKLQEGIPLIANTDLSSGQGIHWICIYPKDQYAMIIDPLGSKNFRPNDQIMFEQIEQAGYQPFFWNGKLQTMNSVLCGYFAIYVAKMIKGANSPSQNDVHDMIDQHFGRTADQEDVKKLISGFGLTDPKSGGFSYQSLGYDSEYMYR